MITINQNEVLDKIKDEIHKIHPILNPRKNNEIKSIMEIYFTFQKSYDNKEITTIGFLDGNEHSKVSTSTIYKLDEYVNLEIINKFISYLLNNYPCIVDFSIYSMSFSLTFEYPFEMRNQEGISCDKIILKFNARDKEFVSVLNQYLINILFQFANELSETQTFQYKYIEYCNSLQKKILNSLNDSEVEQMIQILPIEKKRELLSKLQSQYFLQFYQENYYKDKELSKQLVKKEYFIKNN